MATIARTCEQCKKYVEIEASSATALACPQCSRQWGRVQSLENIFERCPVCQCRQFYIQKDFNQLWGCLVLLVGIIFVPLTYGLSLPVCALLDWFIYKRIPTMVVCYRCDAEFRGFSVPGQFKNFMHHIGAKYDKDNPYR